MRGYSVDLRERIVQAAENGKSHSDQDAGRRLMASVLPKTRAGPGGAALPKTPPRRSCQLRATRHAQNAARALLANPGLPAFQLGERQRELQDLTRIQRELSKQLKADLGALTGR